MGVLVSWWQWYPQFLKLEYPTDILFNVCREKCTQMMSLYRENFPTQAKENQVITKPKYVAVNFGRDFIPVIETVYDYTPPGAELIYQAAHPINFVGYQFEGNSPRERKLLRERNYQMKLYKL